MNITTCVWVCIYTEWHWTTEWATKYKCVGAIFSRTWLHDCMWSAWKFVNIDCVVFFFIALVSYCTCTGCMATVQHLYGSVCFLGTPTCMCTGKYSYQHTFREKERHNPLTRWALPHQNYEWKLYHTLPISVRHSAFMQCGKRINKFLCGSGRERSVGDGMAVPERRTRFYKNWWEKELKYSMYKNTYSQSTQMLCITDIVHLVSTQKLT